MVPRESCCVGLRLWTCPANPSVLWPCSNGISRRWPGVNACNPDTSQVENAGSWLKLPMEVGLHSNVGQQSRVVTAWACGDSAGGTGSWRWTCFILAHSKVHHNRAAWILNDFHTTKCNWEISIKNACLQNPSLFLDKNIAKQKFGQWFRLGNRGKYISREEKSLHRSAAGIAPHCRHGSETKAAGPPFLWHLQIWIPTFTHISWLKLPACMGAQSCTHTLHCLL